MKKDELKLREKIKEEMNPNFDEKFWNKYDQEFSQETNWFGYWMPATAMAAIVGALLVYQFNSSTLSDQELTQLAVNSEMFENMELLEELDEEMLAMNDKDWDVLLEEN